MGRVHVRMYGRVDVLVDGQRCLLPAGRSIELLVLLSAWPGTVVLDAMLAGRLADVPTTAVENEVHRMVTGLRRAVTEIDAELGDLWIYNVPGGYQVNADLVTSDLTEAQALLSHDPNDSSVMWWSEPLVGMDPEPFLHVHARLNDLALQLAERSMTEYGSTIGRVEMERLLELLSRHPQEQELWSTLIDTAIAQGDSATVAAVRMELQVMQQMVEIPAEWFERLDAAG